MKRVCVLLILSASLACVSPAVAQVDTDNDGLLDVMELPGFPSDIEFAAVEDLDGVNIFTNADELILQGNQLRIESGDFETLSNLRQLFLGSIVSWECWIERELVWVDESGHEQFELIEHCGIWWESSISYMQPGSFQGLSNLEYLHLAEAKIKSLEIGGFDGLTNLERLHLEGNEISSLENGVFDGLNHLKILHLEWNGITSLKSGAFDRLSNLEHLVLSNNEITSLEGGAFAGLGSLMTLDLSGNPIAKADFSKASFGNLATHVNIERVHHGWDNSFDPDFDYWASTSFPQSVELILDDAELNPAGLGIFLSQVNPVDVSLVGLRFPQEKPEKLLLSSPRLDHLTLDQHLYDSYSHGIDAFASKENNTLTIIGYGDANMDGFFNSSDLVQVFQAGEYEDGIAENSYWTTGDWNGDGDFGSADLVVAFQAGQYEAEAAVVAVPAPSAMVLLLLGLIALSRSRERIR